MRFLASYMYLVVVQYKFDVAIRSPINIALYYCRE